MRFAPPRLHPFIPWATTFRSGLLGLATLGAQSVHAQPLDIDLRLQAAIEARLAGDPAGAAEMLQQLLEDAPGNADIQLQLGFALLALGDLGRSKAAFDQALALAPDYVDANLGLAQIAFRSGDYDLAEGQALIVLQSRSDADAARLIAQIAAARREDRPASAVASRPVPAERVVAAGRPGDLAATAPNQEPADSAAPARWRVDLDGSLSHLSGGAEWREGSLRIGYEVRPGTVLAAGVEASSRPDAFDLYLEGRLDHRVTADLAFHAMVAGTPDPDFRAAFSIGGGIAWRVPQTITVPFELLLDASRAEYAASRTTSVSPGISLHLLDDRITLTARLLNSVSSPGGYLAGYSVRGDVQLGDRLRLFLGYADAPEFDLGQRIDIGSTFGGLSFLWNETTTFRAAVTSERRSVGSDRFVASLGVGFAY